MKFRSHLIDTPSRKLCVPICAMQPNTSGGVSTWIMGMIRFSTNGIVQQVACRATLTWARKSRQKTCNCERLFVRDGGINPLSVFHTCPRSLVV